MVTVKGADTSEQELPVGFYPIKKIVPSSSYGLSELGLRLYLQHARDIQSHLLKMNFKTPRLLGFLTNLLDTWQSCSRDQLKKILYLNFSLGRIKILLKFTGVNF